MHSLLLYDRELAYILFLVVIANLNVDYGQGNANDNFRPGYQELISNYTVSYT